MTSASEEPAKRRAGPIHWHGWRSRVGVALGLGCLTGLLALSPVADYPTRLGIDFLLPLRHAVFGPLRDAEESAVRVVVIDEESYRTPPFSNTPRVAWTPHLGGVIDALSKAGAAVIALDMVFPTSLDRPDLMRGFDRPFLKAVARAGRAGRLILGRVRLSAQTIAPYPGQIRAVGGGRNTRLLNLLFDADDVVRRYGAAWPLENGGAETTLAVELATRLGSGKPDGQFLINFNTGAHDIPSHGFADIWACAEAGRTAFLEKHFKGKIVIVGTALDVEDRHLSARRLMERPWRPDPSRRCVLPVRAALLEATVKRRSLPGVFIHAAAVNTLVHDDALREPVLVARGLLVGGVTALAALLFFMMGPVLGMVAGGGLVVAQIAGGLIAFQAGWVAPLVLGVLACPVAYGLVYAYRALIEGREKRRIKFAFRHYLAPALVERLAENADGLRLGGEEKRITVLFSDIAGFTALSEALSDRPAELVEVLNRYLTVMCDAIELNGGYVDKFVGDAIMALWGAPLSDADAERHAAAAALDCFAALDEFNETIVVPRYGLEPIGTRIGLNSGTAIVGNMGSESRLNYTVIGDMVNLAARLEAANKQYGSRLMIGEETARHLGRDFVMRPLDRLVVKGKTRPERVFELIGRQDGVASTRLEEIAGFRRALALYYRRRFAEARAAFAALAGDDTAAAVYVERCALYEEAAPPPDWDRSFVMTSK